MVEPRRRLTGAQVAEEQYGIERRGPENGELDESKGGRSSRAAEDYSTRGLFRDENFGRESCGGGEPQSVDHSWEGPPPRSGEIYADVGESAFTVRNALGHEEAMTQVAEEGEDEAGSSQEPEATAAPPAHRASIRRRRRKIPEAKMR